MLIATLREIKSLVVLRFRENSITTMAFDMRHMWFKVCNILKLPSRSQCRSDDKACHDKPWPRKCPVGLVCHET